MLPLLGVLSLSHSQTEPAFDSSVFDTVLCCGKSGTVFAILSPLMMMTKKHEIVLGI
jgi:hypothetical protein